MTPPTPGKENICAVVVAYNPDAGFAGRLEAAARQVAAVVVIDNGSQPPLPAEPAGPGAAVHLLHNEQNRGIAAGLNRGLGWADERGFAWALTLDDDSTPLPGMVEGLCEAYRQCPFRRQVGVVAANFLDPVAGRAFYPTYGGARTWLEVPTAVTSGSLMPVALWRQAGAFREDFFIDSVDHEYCLRLRRRGRRIIVSRACAMTHVLGAERSVFRRGSLRITAVDYSPLRRYYITRNQLIVAREYLTFEPGFVVRQLVRALAESAAVLLVESGRRAKLRAMLLGAWHGFIGRTGTAPPWLGSQRT